MGNALCKEPRSGSSPPGTGNAFSNFSSIICPNGLGKGKTHPMRKTYFSRSAVDASKKTTSATGWQSVGLHVPDGSGRQQKVIDTPPVAPPRKKRGATLDGRYRSDEALKVKNGFQDVFGRESRRHSCDVPSVTRPASVPPPRPDVAALPARQTSCFEIDASNDAFSDFSKVPTTAELERTPSTSQIPRVGNRKSDKFFGERLADSLSPDQENARDEQRKPKKDRSNSSLVRDDVDKIEKFVEHREATTEMRQKSTPEKQPEQPRESAAPSPSANKTEGEDLMKYIDRTVKGDNQIGRRAEFLMAMLEDYNDSVRYEGMAPVEEPLIVPKRRKSKHICDDHDHMHHKLQAHERDASAGGNVIRTEVSIEHAPRKPSRDFSRYKPIDVDPSSGGSDGEQGSIVRPVRTKQKTKSRESPSPVPPPDPPRFKKSLSETQFAATSTPLQPPKDEAEPKAHTPRMLKRIISMPTTENLAKEPLARPDTPQRPILTKSSSSGSFSAVDLQRTRICVERFTPEDYAHRSSGADELVKPKSKLTTRKISWKSNESPVCQTPTPTTERPTGASFTIGGTTVVTSDSPSQLAPPEVPKRKHSDASTGAESTGPEKQVVTNAVSTPPIEDPEDRGLRQFCLGSFIESSRVLPHHDVVNVLGCVYDATDNKENIVEQFQTFLEEALSAELNEPNPSNPNISKLLEKLSQTSSDGDKQLENVTLKLVGSSHSSSSDMDDCFDPEFEKIEKSEVVGELPKIDHSLKHGGGRRRDSIEYMSDWFGGESDGSTTMLSSVGVDEVKASDRMPAKPPMLGASPYGGRKESIEDVGSWFSNHNVLRPSFGEEFEEPSRRLRRGSDGFLGYDLQRQYPFGKGRERSDSLSAEMFEGITKLQEQRSDQQAEPSPFPHHPQRKKVLEHRNSSDALLMKVLTRSNRAQHHNSEQQKQPEEPKPVEAVDEGNPLLNVTSKHNSTESDPVQEASKATIKDGESSPAPTESNEHEHSEHSTLLKFLSKEKLIE